jgi:hypothetical protein
VVLLVLMVIAGHFWLASMLPDARLGEGAADRMPRRIEVAYVRELAQATPPVVAPVVVRPRKVARPKPATPVAPAQGASAPLASSDVLPTPPPDLATAGNEPPAPELPAVEATASQPDAAPPPPQVPVESAAAPSAEAAVAFEWPPSTRLTYRLSGNYRGEVVGGAMVEWVRVESRYQVHMDVFIGAQAAPLVARRMTSDGDLTEDGLVPRRYDEETRALFRQVRRRTIVFDADNVLLPNGKTLPRVRSMQDAASQFVQLSWLFTIHPELLQVGRSIELTLALPTNVSRWAYDVMSLETLQTPLGSVAAYRLKPRRELRPGGDLVAEVWFAPSLQYLPVRLLIRQDADTFVDLLLDQAPQQAAQPR